MRPKYWRQAEYSRRLYDRARNGDVDAQQKIKAKHKRKYERYKQSDEYKIKRFEIRQRHDLKRMKQELRELEKEAQLHLRRECKCCGFVFYMAKRYAPLMGCCSRLCLQKWKIENGHRKPPPPKRNDPAESGVVYGLVDPDTKQIRYIGKATNFKNRMARYRCGDYSNPHQRNWLEKLKREGKWCEERVLEECLFNLGEAERKWIKIGREKGWPLTNQTDGGDSGKRSHESIEKGRARMIAFYQSPVEKRKHRLNSQRVAARKIGMTLEAYRIKRAQEAREQRYRKQNAEAIRQREAIRRQAESDQQQAAERDARLRAFGVLAPLTCKGAAFVPLTRGAWAVVDAEDWGRVSQYKWALQVKRNCNGATYHRAKRSFSVSGKDGGLQLLSRFIANTPDGSAVRHQDGNQLNCRKSNLCLYLPDYRVLPE